MKSTNQVVVGLVIFFVAFFGITTLFFSHVTKEDPTSKIENAGQLNKMLDEDVQVRAGDIKIPRGARERRAYLTRPQSVNKSVPQWGSLKSSKVVPVAKNSKNSKLKKAKKKTKKKKKVAKNKRKKKKKKKKQEIENQETDFDSNIVKKSKEPTPSADVGGGGLVTSVSPAVAEGGEKGSPGGIPTNVQEWETLLLNEPTSDNIHLFLKYQQAGLIENSQFYGILDRLINEGSPKAREIAVTALGSVIGASSFIRLVNVIENEEGDIVTYAENHIKKYELLQNVSALGIVLSTDVSSTTKIIASQIIRDSARKNSSIQSSSDQRRGGRLARSRRTQTTNSQIYIALANNLEALANSDPDVTVRNAASDSLATIRSIYDLGTNTNGSQTEIASENAGTEQLSSLNSFE